MRALAPLLLGALLLAGCAGDPPGPTSPMSPSTSTGTSPVASTPTTPTTETTSSAAGTRTHVHVACCTFDPKTLDVATGGAVDWHGHDGGHTVTIHRAGDPAGTYVKDESLANGGTVSHTFSTAGTYHVFCKPHSDGETGDYSGGMVSTITVA